MPNRSAKLCVDLTAFGKHPAWGDHIDDLPLPGPELAAFKHALYDQGIQSAITRWIRPADNPRDPDPGAAPTTPAATAAPQSYDRVLDSGDADPAAGLLPLDHHAIWIRGAACIFARLGPSADRAGRAKFPLVVAAQVQGIAPADAADILPDLDRLFDACAAASTQDEVRAALAEARAEIIRALSDNAPSADDWRSALTEGLADPALETARILRHLRLQTEGSRRPGAPASHLRAPGLDLPFARAATTWRRLLADRLPDPLLALAPRPDARARPWLDLFAPATDALDLVRIRSSREPLATAIAYDLDARPIAEASRLLGLGAADSPRRSAQQRARRGPRLELFLGGLLAIVGLGLLGVVIFVAVRGT